MDGPYRLTTRKTSKDRILGHWYYRFKNNPWTPTCSKTGELGELELKIWGNGVFVDPKNTFINHEKAKYWSKKNKVTPNQVALKSGKKYWFNCPNCPHDFDATLLNVNCGKWCPYCAIYRGKLCGNIECDFCLKKSLASHEKAKYRSKKNNKKPHEVPKSSSIKYLFDCPNCPHDFDGALNNVMGGKWCPYCCIPCKKLCGNIECNFCFKKSIAIHTKAKHWSKKNKLKPRFNKEIPKSGDVNKIAGTKPISDLIKAVNINEIKISLFLIGVINKFVKFLLHISSRNNILKPILVLNKKS